MSMHSSAWATARPLLFRCGAHALASGFALLVAGASAHPQSVRSGAGVGFLEPSPGLLDLPPGFHHRVVAGPTTLYSDGTLRPARADGMGAFPGPNGTVLLCVNHELSGSQTPEVPPVAEHYDPSGIAGTSVMVVDARRHLVEARVSSSGTLRNCSGGATPWNTWITVEESLTRNGSFTHGWAFEVDPYAPLGGGAPRQARLDPLGRFYREAVAVDPGTRIVYQTEDRTDGLLYRFVPSGPQPGAYGDYAAAAGQLQALYLPGLPLADAADEGDAFVPRWISVPDPDGDPTPTRQQSYLDDQGAPVEPTRFYRGEGAAWSAFEGALYFDATGGGTSGHRGQIWRYHPPSGVLTLVVESTDAARLDMPDNLAVLPSGSLVICEDGGPENHLRILTPGGTLIDFAATTVSEIAGASWDPRTATLYVNLQGTSTTVAIWGPWSLLGV